MQANSPTPLSSEQLVALEAGSFLIGFAILVLLSPLLWACVTAGIPGRFYSDLFEIDRKNSKVTKSTRGLFLQCSCHRDFRDISALLVIKDKARYGLLGIGPRIGLFLCLGPKAVRRRVLFIDYMFMPSPKDKDRAMNTAKSISGYSGWPIETLTLSEKMSDEDVQWENW